MTYIDVAIPGIFGLVMTLWPQAMFFGSKVTPDPKRIRLLRRIGTVLLGVACLFLVVRLIEALRTGA